MRSARKRPDPELFHRAETVFHSALERPAHERSVFVEQSCSGDSRLQQEVERLLAGDGEPSPFSSGLLEPADPLARTGSRVGPFRLLAELGRGGMGTIWLAQRADETFDQTVAIKLIRRGRDTDEVLRRFENERQVLAGLQHPHIAPLLDGGTTSDGRPYLVLQHIDGVPLDRYCEEEQLSVNERLQLFRKVCGAVHYAHQNLVIHRDLKPSNILVTASGEPKLLDFGIAKVLGEHADANLTTTGTQPLTPGFASPEQLNGRTVTTASDVYSLGALLYRILAGRDPYELDGRSVADCVRLICEETPTRPSALARVSRDLDTIVLAALRKEPERRYASVERLSADIQSFLDGMPVEARGESLGYVTGKFVRRHKLAFAAGLAVVGALVGGLYVATAARDREATQRVLAETRLGELERLAADLDIEKQAVVEQQAIAEQRFEDIREFATTSTVDLVTTLRPIAGTTVATEKVIALGLDYLERLAPHARDDPDFAFELARSYLRLGQLQGDYGSSTLGRTDLALVSTQRGAQAAERLWQETPDSLPIAQLTAGARQQEAKLLRALGRSDEASTSLERALEICETFDGASGLEVPHFYTWALCTVAKHDALVLERRHEEALQHGERALEIYDRALERWPEALELRTDRARALAGLAQTHAALGALDEAIAAQVESLMGMNAIIGGQENTWRAERDVLLMESSLAFYLGSAGDFEAARELIDRVVEQCAERARLEPGDRQAALDRAIALTGSGNVYQLAGDFQGARPVLERALSAWSEMVARDPERASFRIDRADGLTRLARAERGGGRLAEAHGHLAEALAERGRLHAADPDNTELALQTIDNCVELAAVELDLAGGPEVGTDAGAARVADAQGHLARGRSLLEAAASRGMPGAVLARSRDELERVERRCRALQAN